MIFAGLRANDICICDQEYNIRGALNYIISNMIAAHKN